MSYTPGGSGGSGDSYHGGSWVKDYDQCWSKSTWQRSDRFHVPSSSNQGSLYPKILIGWTRKVLGECWMALGQGTQQTNPATNGIGTTQKANEVLPDWNDPATLVLLELPTPALDWDKDSCILDWGATSATTARGKTLNAEWGTNISLSEPTMVELWLINNNSGSGQFYPFPFGFILDPGGQL